MIDREESNKTDENHDKKHPNKQRNRSKSFFVNAKDDQNSKGKNKSKRRKTISDASDSKMRDDDQDDNSTDDESSADNDYDDVSLYSDRLYNTNTMGSAISVLESSQPPIQHPSTNNSGGLSIIHSSSEHSQINSSNNSPSTTSISHNNNNNNKLDNNLVPMTVDNILFEDFEGNGNQGISKNFHRKKKNLESNKNGITHKYRKPSSSAASNISSQSSGQHSSGHTSNQSQVSISSIAITEINDNVIMSRSVPHSPEPTNKSNKSYFIDKALNNHTNSVLNANSNTIGSTINIQQQRDTPRNSKKTKRRQSAGASTHHLYPTPKKTTPNGKPTRVTATARATKGGDLPKKGTHLTQSHSAHAIVATPQRPNTPTNLDNDNNKTKVNNHNNSNQSTNPTTPTNTPLMTNAPSMLNTVSVMSPPINGFDTSASIYNYGSGVVNINTDNKNGRRRNSLTPPQEDKEQDDISIAYIPMNISEVASSSNNTGKFQLEPLTFLDDQKHSDDDNDMDGGKIIIVDEDEMIINGDKVQELPLHHMNYDMDNQLQTEYHHHGSQKENLVEEAANILFTTSALPLTNGDQQNGEDSVSISMNSSRPPSTRVNKNVHFDMNSMNKVSSMEDIEENKESADEDFIDENTPEVVNHHNLLPSLVNRRKSRTKKGGKTRRKYSDTKQSEQDKKVSKLKNHIAHHSLIKNGKQGRGNIRKLRLSQQNLRAHNGLNQLKNKLMDAKLEKKDVAKMSNEQLQEMLIYINRIQWLILDEKQRRECCLICGIPSTSFILLLPCRHQRICNHCSSNLQMCPICHQNVTDIIKPRRK